MPTRTEICNMALVQIGASPDLQSIETDDGELAEVVKLGYGMNRDAALAEHPWNFARTFAKLPKKPDAEASDYGYANVYALPTSPYCLRVWRLNPAKHGPFPTFAVKGREIVTDEGPPLYIDYIARIEDEGKFSPQFAEMLALRIAWWLAPRISGHRSVQGQIWELYKAMLRDARSADGQEGRAEQDPGEFLTSRY